MERIMMEFWAGLMNLKGKYRASIICKHSDCIKRRSFVAFLYLVKFLVIVKFRGQYT